MVCQKIFYFLIFNILGNIIYVQGCEIKNSNEFLFDGQFEFIDLTHSFDKNTVYWSDSRNFTFTNKVADFTEDGSW